MGTSDVCRATLTAFRSAYGESVSYDSDQVGIKWAKFCHFYEPYYFFQYAVGISAAMSIGKRLLDGERGLQERYLSFLAAGDSMPPIEIFKIVGLDITSKDVYSEAFKVVEGYVERLERL